MSQKRYRIMVVDDEYWVCENLRSILDWDKHGFVFLEPAFDGVDALDRIALEKPDIVISDVNMPHMSGTELIAECSDRFPDTVFIALSGYSDYQFVRTSLVGGAIDYLLKPIGEVELTSVLARAVDKLTQRDAQVQNRTEAQELKRHASMLALDREFSSYLKKTSDRNDSGMLSGRLTYYELEYSGFALVLFNAPRLFRKSTLSELLCAERTICSIKEIIEQGVNGAKHFVFNNSQKTSEFILVTEMRIYQLLEVCEALLPKLCNAVGSSFTVVISNYYYSFKYLADAYEEVSFSLMSVPFVNEPLVISSTERNAPPGLTRVTPETEKQLAQAIPVRRSLFEDLLYRKIGFKSLPAEKWTYGEMRQAVAAVAWILHSGENNRAKMFVLDSLTEVLLKAVDSFDREEVLDILDQMIQERFPQPDHPRQSANIERIVEQIREYISANYFEDLSLNILSERYHIESSYLSRSFKRSTGVNLTFYITHKRVERAKEYLAEGVLNIKEISQLVGYGDYAYFSRIFRKMTGVSPKHYQEQKDGDANVKQ